MADTIVNIKKTRFQHGKQSDRVYLMRLDNSHRNNIIKTLQELAITHGYSKIIAKIPWSLYEMFSAEGYHNEAKIIGYYCGKEDCAFMCKYMRQERAICDRNEIEKVIAAALSKRRQAPLLSAKYELKTLQTEDIDALAALYSEVFESYPFPIYDPKYVAETFSTGVKYFGIFQDGCLIAASSAETEEEYLSAEMTDFAVKVNYRGQDLAAVLLDYMESELKKTGYFSLYTIARSVSYGMNCTFAKAGYNYTGTLINNTHISGGIESMNVWCKSINSADEANK